MHSAAEKLMDAWPATRCTRFRKKTHTKTFQFYKRKDRIWKRLDVWPFVCFVYPILGSQWAIHTRNSLSDTSLPDAVASHGVHTRLVVLGVIGAISVFLQVLCHLATHWVLRWRLHVGYKRLGNEPKGATHVLVSVHGGTRRSALCPILLQPSLSNDKESLITIHYLKKRYIYCPTTALKRDSDSEVLVSPLGLVFRPLYFPIDRPLATYCPVQQKALRGLDGAVVRQRTLLYGPNNFDIVLPTFGSLYLEHAVSPFFVFQIFCVVLWMLDEYWKHSLMTLFLLMFLEAQLVMKVLSAGAGDRLGDLKNLKEMRVKGFPILCLRDGAWSIVSSDGLVPGDIIALSRKHALSVSDDDAGSNDVSSLVCPCDVAVLYGTAIVNESALTGESVPQTKVALGVDPNTALRLKSKNVTTHAYVHRIVVEKPARSALHRQHVLFAGTRIIAASGALTAGTQYVSPRVLPGHLGAQKPCCIGYVLRTGFETTQGKIVRTILFASERVTAENREALWFLFVLLLCSIAASSYVFWHSLWGPGASHKRGLYKLLLNCVMIVTSVVPPEFPITMSMAVTLSIVELVKKKIFCTEPFRLPYAGRATVCAFDKTGTLTSEEMEVQAVVGTSFCPQSACETDGSSSSKPAVQSLSAEAVAVLAGCQSLARLSKEGAVGDPIEKAALSAVGWTLNQSNSVCAAQTFENKKRHTEPDQLTVLRRFPFVSELQRMTVIAQHTGRGFSGRLRLGSEATKAFAAAQGEVCPDSESVFKPGGLYVLTKGSPETVGTLLKDRPSTYDRIASSLSRAGFRILALALKPLNTDTSQGGNTVSEWVQTPRDVLENGLFFAGFLTVSCKIKPHTIAAITSLRESAHRLIMITGDHPLTACQTALDTGLVYRSSTTPPQQLFSESVLQDSCLLHKAIEREESLEGFSATPKRLPFSLGSVFHPLTWSTRDGLQSVRVESDEALRELSRSYSLCVTGNSIDALTECPETASTLRSVLLNSVIFARVSPQQKQRIVQELMAAGDVVVMCGDGTNDVGALKAAHVGVSLLSTSDGVDGTEKPSKKSSPSKKKETFKERLERMVEEEKRTSAGTQPQLGTASIASPFTHKGNSIRCVPALIRLGRATLSTVMTSYKTMAINALITAFSLSVLTLDGVKLGDFQTTIENFFISFLVFVSSRARPSRYLSVERPIEKIFCAPTLLSIFGQASLHLLCLFLGWHFACLFRDPETYTPDIDGAFHPNLVNTVVFLILSGMHGAAFVANYDGAPFMIPLRENTLLCKGLLIFYGALALLVFEVFPDLNASFSLVPFPSLQLKGFIAVLLLMDTGGCWLLGELCNRWGIHQATVQASKRHA